MSNAARFRRGDHLVVSRGLYTHHGIYAGDGFVVHKDFGPVRLTSLAAFARRRKVRVAAPEPGDFPRAVVLARARSRLGEERYDLLTDNCEHFVTWCRTGRAGSPQVAAGVIAVGVGLAARQALMLHPAAAAAVGLATYLLLGDDARAKAVGDGLKSVGAALRGLGRYLPSLARG